MGRPEKIDQAVIDNLKKLGDGIEEDHNVDFYLYFKHEHNAYNVAAELGNYLFKTQISYSNYSKQWLCLTSKKMKVTTKRLIETGNLMEQLASQHEGNYDGWETMLVECKK